MATPAFRRFSSAVIVATLAVILWGAYVRASGSGAGCGSHWPTCNGQIIPRPKNLATVIEFTHRATSGLVLLLIVAQMMWALRVFPRGHAIRRAAAATTVFIVTEALVGAGLVLFEMVAGNKSLARAAWIASHLVNTFALLAAMVITRWLAGRTDDPPPPERSPPRGAIAALLCGLGATVLVATSGAVAALGDTLFPARSLAEGLQQDLSAASHLFLRLRIFHPVLAVASAAYLVVVAALLASRVRGARHLFTALGALVLTQVAVGLLNLALLAPIPLQILHLLLADLVWIVLVLATATLWRARSSSA